LNGAGAISLSGTTHTLTTSNGVLSDGQFGVLVFGGSPSGTNTVTIAPNTAQKIYWVRNTTAEDIVLTQGSGGDVTVPAGTVKAVYANGAGAGAVVVDLTNVLSMGNPAITGGTINGAVIGGATPAAAAFTTLTATTSLTSPLLTNAGTLALSATGANAVTISTNGVERARIDSAGNTGFGTSSPATKLDIQTDTQAVGVTVRSTSDTAAVAELGIGMFNSNTPAIRGSVNGLDIGINDTGRFAVFTENTERLRVSTAGDVGIGTTSPAERLHVNGTVRATGLNLNGTAVTATAAELNILDGVTASTAELNILDGVTATAAQINRAVELSARNAIINGNFGVNQRFVSGTVTLAAGAYGHDRWKAGSSGCTYTFATSGNVTTLTISAGSLLQVIEGINLFSGTYALSWAGTAQGKIGAGAFGNSGITGSVTGGTNLNIEFGTGTVSLVQFEQGTVATPFEHRSFGQELALCQRYFEVGETTANYNTMANRYLNVPFVVTKRAAPTMTRTGPGELSSGTDGTITSTPTTQSFYFFQATNTNIVGGSWTASAEL
jgi:hypothetical protein